MAMEAAPDLSTQEHEMLQYLEDMRRDNPAEYEQLVQQLQLQQAAKRGAKGSMVVSADEYVQQANAAASCAAAACLLTYRR